MTGERIAGTVGADGAGFDLRRPDAGGLEQLATEGHQVQPGALLRLPWLGRSEPEWPLEERTTLAQGGTAPSQRRPWPTCNASMNPALTS